jgi:hypothetical protein
VTQTREQLEARARSIVEMAGGVFQGVQHIDSMPGLDDLILFAWHPLASTRAVSIHKLSVAAVRERLEKDLRV